MKEVVFPKVNCYNAPKDFAFDSLHYCVVQTSERSWFVAMYDGSTSAVPGKPMANWAICSKRFSSWLKAAEHAAKLTDERIAYRSSAQHGKLGLSE